MKKKKNSLLKCITIARERACKWKLFRRKIIHDHHPPIRKIFVTTASLALDYTLPIKVWKTRIHGRKGTIQRSNRLFYNRRKLKNRKKKKKGKLTLTWDMWLVAMDEADCCYSLCRFLLQLSRTLIFLLTTSRPLPRAKDPLSGSRIVLSVDHSQLSSRKMEKCLRGFYSLQL